MISKIYIYLFILFIFMQMFVKEDFYGWIPISSRSTRNMSYDLRGDPYLPPRLRYFYPYRTKGYRGPFVLRLFPFWHRSPYIPNHQHNVFISS